MSKECCAIGAGFGITVTIAPCTAASIAALISSTLFNVARSPRSLALACYSPLQSPALLNDLRDRPCTRIAGRLQIMLAEFGYREFARCFLIQMPRPLFAGEVLLVDFLLQCHERLDQRLGPGRASGNVYVNGYIAIYALEHVVSLLERSAGDCTGAHCNYVPRFGHLVIEPHYLRSHLLRDRTRDDHQVSLPR